MRRDKITVVAGIALLMISSSAFASNEAKSGAPISAAATASNTAPMKDVGERKTCRRFEASESRMKSKRLCLTRAQWKEFRDAE